MPNRQLFQSLGLFFGLSITVTVAPPADAQQSETPPVPAAPAAPLKRQPAPLKLQSARALQAQEKNQNTTSETVTRLIKQLGADKFAARERATEQLILLGLPAVKQLEHASRSENREIRHRSALVLSVVHELDFDSRLKAFEADVEGDESYGLPGWERFRELAGQTAPARKLFASIQRTSRELVNAEAQPVKAAAITLEQQSQRLRYSTQIFGTRHELPPIAAALFIATNPDIPLSKSTNISLMNLCHQEAFEYGIASPEHQTTLRNLLAAWILREDAVPAHELMLLALQHRIDRVLPRARRVVKQPADADLYDRNVAVLCLAKFGSMEDVATLEAMLEDKNIIARYRLNSMTYTVEIRDLVLASLLALTKREVAAFGYSRLRMQEPLVFDTQTLGFATDEDRQVALAKWRLYRMHQVDR